LFADLLIISIMLTAFPTDADAQAMAISVIPRPVSLTVGEGSFTVRGDTKIVTDKATHNTGRMLARWLAPATGSALKVAQGQDADNAVSLKLDDSLTELGDEGYRLDVAPQRVTIRAPHEAGVFYGAQTLRQLLPPAIFSSSQKPGIEWRIPVVRIEDRPRFRWRGAMLDVSRHFMPKDFVLRFIDLLALHKLNVFHWHLTDDQGWRIEIKKYPRLTQVGAWRKETRLGHERTPHGFDKTPHGGFYTQREIRDVVEYARQRHITIVPEIEMPGHAQAAIAAYPELGVKGEQLEVWTRWGINANIFNPSEKTIHFLQDVLSEVIKLFPGQFIHVGGDEAKKDEWQASPQVQARIKELGLKDEHEMQSYFIRRMDAFLTSKGKRLIGWDEILEGGLAAGATVMSWRGIQGGITAAKSGHDVVMAPTTHTYLDYYQSRDAGELPAIGGYLPLETVYSFEPIPAELTAQESGHVLGGQAQLWSEYLPTPGHVEYMAFPRLIALAEVTWSPKEQKNYENFLARLVIHEERLKLLNVNFRTTKKSETK
jgi:hexosaminidase